MPGDAPPPGETPRETARAESRPDPLPEPGSGRRHPGADGAGEEPPASGDEADRRRHPRRRPPPADGPQPGGGTGTLFPQREQPPYARAADPRDRAREPEPALKQRAGGEPRTEPGGVELDHNRPDRFRYDPLRPPAGYAGMIGRTGRPAQPPAETGAVRTPAAAPGRTETAAAGTEPVPAQAIEPVPTQTEPVPAHTGTAPAHTERAPTPAETAPAHTETVPALTGTAPAHTDPAQEAEPPTAAAHPSGEARAWPPVEGGTRRTVTAGAQPPAATAPPRTDSTRPTGTDQARAEPPLAAEPPPTLAEQDVMLLPEPDSRNRPTIALERRPVPGEPPAGPVPGQIRVHPTEPLPRPTGHAATDARLEKLENSPFWLDDPERAAAKLHLPEVSSHTAGRGRRGPRVRRRAIRRPGPALFALITLALVAAFFSWVSAEPFWLAVGHGDRGYATTIACRGTGIAQRCAGRFDAADGSFTVNRVDLLGVAGNQRAAGAVTPARMVGAGSRTAYVGDTGPLAQLRWMLGFALVSICGYGIASRTGARRHDDARSRRLVILASVLAPLLLLAGFLFAAY